VRRIGGEVVEQDIVPEYVLALQLRARYLPYARQYDDARRSYDDAFAYRSRELWPAQRARAAGDAAIGGRFE
jgi:hypothetical protein